MRNLRINTDGTAHLDGVEIANINGGSDQICTIDGCGQLWMPASGDSYACPVHGIAAHRTATKIERAKALAKALAKQRFGVLNCDSVHMTPIDVDWGEAFVGTDHEEPRAELIYPDFSEEIDEKAAELAQEAPEEFEPMMSCAYPLPKWSKGSPGAAQAQLGGLILVMLDGEPCLALNGGGMDFSWEICEAYASLGFRPPLHFCNLPVMSGRGESDRDLAIMGACLESAEVAARWAQNTSEQLAELIVGAS